MRRAAALPCPLRSAETPVLSLFHGIVFTFWTDSHFARCTAITEVRLVARIQKALFEAIIRQDMLFFDSVLTRPLTCPPAPKPPASFLARISRALTPPGLRLRLRPGPPRRNRPGSSRPGSLPT